MWAQSAAEIGRIIATARKARALTQTQLARELGVTQNWLSEIERGKDTAHIGKVLRVLSFLGVRLEVGEAPWLTAVEPNPARPVTNTLDDILKTHSSGARRRRPLRRRRRKHSP